MGCLLVSSVARLGYFGSLRELGCKHSNGYHHRGAMLAWFDFASLPCARNYQPDNRIDNNLMVAEDVDVDKDMDATILSMLIGTSSGDQAMSGCSQ